MCLYNNIYGHIVSRFIRRRRHLNCKYCLFKANGCSMTDNNDNFQIDSESQYKIVHQTLTKQNKPSSVLRFLMRAMESYRSARKMGWSRPWNKYGVVNFQSFRVRPMEDTVLLNLATQILETECKDLPDKARCFVEELLSDKKKLMGFIFIHEVTENKTVKFEGATLSLGRVNNKRFRDRLDIILESPVHGGASVGLKRLRIFVDPYNKQRKQPLWQYTGSTQTKFSNNLFAQLSHYSWEWQNQQDRRWDHWTSKYIDYFGPRQWSLDRTYFFSCDNPQARISPDDTNNLGDELDKRAC